MPNGDDDLYKTGHLGGGGGLQLGSHRIVTINLPWVAYESKTSHRDVYEILTELLDDAVHTLVAHKVLLKKFIDAHLLLFFDLGWMNLDQLYSTVGFHGFPEFLKILGFDYASVSGRKFGKEILMYIRQRMADCSRRMSEIAGMKIKINMEEIPAEGSTSTLAKLNNMRFKTRDEFYSNQFVPLYDDIPLHERLLIESELSSVLTGGSMTTININDPMDEDNSYKLHRRILENTDISQFSINYGWSMCTSCGKVTVGMHDKCSCGGINQVFTRVVGYVAPVQNWSRTRQDELGTRKWYKV
jgi:ribonucleoside-triphosphate reductase